MLGPSSGDNEPQRNTGKLKPRNTRRCRDWWEREKREAEAQEWRMLGDDERERRHLEDLLGKKFNTLEEARAERWKRTAPPDLEAKHEVGAVIPEPLVPPEVGKGIRKVKA